MILILQFLGIFDCNDFAMKKIYFLLILLFPMLANAQLTEMNFADFTFNDIDGNQHNLYNYLDQEKIVVLDIFTTWCTNCLNAIPAVKAVWEARGPEGDDSIVMLYFERDPNTSNEAAYVQQHNLTIPVITEATQQVLDWGITYQPVYIVVCPDRSYEMHLGSIGAQGQSITALIDQCAETVGLEEELQLTSNVYSDGKVVHAEIESNRTIALSLYNLMGSKIRDVELPSGNYHWRQSDLQAGIYILRLNDESYKVVIQ